LFRVDIYFAGSQWSWGGKPTEMERLGSLPAKWLWLARRLRDQALKSWLNADRCVIDIYRTDGEQDILVERRGPQSPEIIPAVELDHGFT
jgi:hypothetical protein